MALKDVVPNSSAELHRYLLLVHENRAELDSIAVNLNTSALEVRLKPESKALEQCPEYRIPLRNASLGEASEIVSVIRRQFQYGDAPSQTSAERLYSCLRSTTGL